MTSGLQVGLSSRGLGTSLFVGFVIVSNPVLTIGFAGEAEVRAYVEKALQQADGKTSSHSPKNARAAGAVGLTPVTLHEISALSHAKCGKYGEMAGVYDRLIPLVANNRDLHRLRAWARMSSGNYTGASQDVLAFIKFSLNVATARTPRQRQKTTNQSVTEEVVDFAGKSVGFLIIVGEQQTSQADFGIDKIREEITNNYEDEVAARFVAVLSAEKHAIELEFARLAVKQNIESEGQLAARDSEEQRLLEEQAAWKTAASETRAAAQAIQAEAFVKLRELQIMAMPLQRELIGLRSELNALLSSRSGRVDEFGNDPLQPSIDLINSGIKGVQQRLIPITAAYSRIEQTAIAQLNALGFQLKSIGQNHHANEIRRRKNALKSVQGKTPEISRRIHHAKIFAKRNPLDFRLETDRLIERWKSNRPSIN